MNLRKSGVSYDWRGLEFPIVLDKIDIFELKNDISMNVLAIEAGKEKLHTLRKAKFDNQSRTGNILLIANDEKKHYAVIKNLSRLLTSSNSDGKRREHFCLNCLQGFHSEGSRDKQYEYCVDSEVVRIDMPEENYFVRSQSGQYQFKVPFAIYADFEAILQEEGKIELYDSSIPEDSYKSNTMQSSTGSTRCSTTGSAMK